MLGADNIIKPLKFWLNFERMVFILVKYALIAGGVFLAVWANKIRIYMKWEKKKKHNVAPFYRWKESVHQEPDQKERIRQAREEKFIIQWQDKEKGLARIKFDGEESFVWCNLGMCQCAAFKEEHKPCKHIYKIAIEKGLIE